MNDRHDFDAWHADDAVSPHDDVEEVDARNHDLWGFSDRSADDHLPSAAPRRRSGRPEWFAPVLVMMLAALAFGGAWLLTRSSNSTPDAAPSVVASTSGTSTPATPSASSTEQASSTAASPSGSSSASASGSSSSSSSTSSSASSTASAPADAVTTCGDGQPIGDGAVRLGAGTHSSCAYITDAVAQVRTHVAEDANASSFSITPYSAVLGRTVPLSCTRADHLTACSGGNNVRFWVTG